MVAGVTIAESTSCLGCEDHTSIPRRNSKHQKPGAETLLDSATAALVVLLGTTHPYSFLVARGLSELAVALAQTRLYEHQDRFVVEFTSVPFSLHSHLHLSL